MSKPDPDHVPTPDPVDASDETSAQVSVPCQRLDRDLPVKEHAECPYCCGKNSEILTGDHKKFCDFHKGEDPINFGFPDDLSRNVRG